MSYVTRLGNEGLIVCDILADWDLNEAYDLIDDLCVSTGVIAKFG